MAYLELIFKKKNLYKTQIYIYQAFCVLKPSKPKQRLLNKVFSCREFVFYQLQELCDLHGSEQNEWHPSHDTVPGERGNPKSIGG